MPAYENIPAPEPEVLNRVRSRPVAWMTWLLLGSTIVVFLFQLHGQHATGEDDLGESLAFSPAAWAAGRYWTLVTYAWAHAVAMFGDPGLFWVHIVSNMILLVCLGPAVEEFLGPWRYLGLYLGGAVASALTWFCFNLDAGDQGIIGASGAVFALLAAAGTIAPRARVVVYLLFFIPIRMTLGILALAICGLEVVLILVGWLPGLAHSAHLGGAAFGVVYILAVRAIMWRRVRASYLQKGRGDFPS